MTALLATCILSLCAACACCAIPSYEGDLRATYTLRAWVGATLCAFAIGSVLEFGLW